MERKKAIVKTGEEIAEDERTVAKDDLCFGDI